MAAYVLSQNANIRQLNTAGYVVTPAARAGGDTIDTNGFIFTIDQDTRYGLGGTTSTSFGSMTVNATKGGGILIDGRYVRLIPFNTGSGTITAGATITCGSATGTVIGIYSSMTTAPVLTGVATGWIKVCEWNGVAFPTSGSYTQAGYTFTITGASTVGWIDVVGDEAATINANRLGTVQILGEWYALGTTSGASNQTLQIPNNGLLKYAAGVYIEKNAGQADYEFYPNAGTTTTTGTDSTRGKVVWISDTGLVRIGNSGAATNGYTPASGLAIVVPNVFLENCTTAARTANVIPNATIATRYDFTTTGGGVVTIDKANLAWYLSCTQAYSVTLTNSCFIDAILLSEVASPMTVTKCGVGNKPTTALLVSGLTMTYCYAGGTFTDCVWSRVSMAASGAYTITINDIEGFTFIREVCRANTIKANATTYSHSITRAKNCTYTNPTIIQGPMALITCDNITVTDLIYANCVSGTTVTTYATQFYLLSSNTVNCTFSGATIPITNTHPYTSLLGASTGCSNIKMRNIGTRVSPLSMGSANICGLIYTIATNCSNFKFQRIYVAGTRTGIMTGDNSCKNIIEEHVFGDYADNADVMACLNMTRKAMGGIGAYTAQVSVYGTHWSDSFTSTTAGRINILMNEPTTDTASQVTLVNGANFTSAGGLYMPVIGMQATFEMPGYIKGHTSFQNSALVMAGGTASNYTYNFQIDKNDGNGFSAWNGLDYTTAALFGTALNGITGIDASLGFKLKIRITTGTTNTTAITSVYVLTNSSTTAQDYQYPLETVTVSVLAKDAATGGVIQNAHVYIIADEGGALPAGTVILKDYTNASGIASLSTFEYTGASQPITGRIRKSSASPFYKTSPISGNITSTGFSTTVFLVSDE